VADGWFLSVNLQVTRNQSRMDPIGDIYFKVNDAGSHGNSCIFPPQCGGLGTHLKKYYDITLDHFFPCIKNENVFEFTT